MPKQKDNQRPSDPRPGEDTIKAIESLPGLVDRLISEFRAEPCPQDEQQVRELVNSALVAVTDLLVQDAQQVAAALPEAASSALDHEIRAFHVAEVTDAVTASTSAGLKKRIIKLIKLLLSLIPRKYEKYKKILEAIIQIIEAFQEDK